MPSAGTSAFCAVVYSQATKKRLCVSYIPLSSPWTGWRLMRYSAFPEPRTSWGTLAAAACWPRWIQGLPSGRSSVAKTFCWFRPQHHMLNRGRYELRTGVEFSQLVEDFPNHRWDQSSFSALQYQQHHSGSRQGLMGHNELREVSTSSISPTPLLLFLQCMRMPASAEVFIRLERHKAEIAWDFLWASF